MIAPNTLFLRLEGPLQAWGNCKMVIRRTFDAPSKSGVLGMICCAMGRSRAEANSVLARLNKLAMGVRVDRPGRLWCDYHTVGAGFGMLTAQGKLKKDAQGTLVTRRYYLCDASFLLALQGDEAILQEMQKAFRNPLWPIFLGRKSCPPSVPVLNRQDGENLEPHESLKVALESKRWRPRYKQEACGATRKELHVILEWRPNRELAQATQDAETWHDVPVSFDPPVHAPRLVVRDAVSVSVDTTASQDATPVSSPSRADYSNKKFRDLRKQRIAEKDQQLCVFCKSPAGTVQHITYRHAGGDERLEELRSLCRLCHDAVTMIEYGLGMGLDRINPEEPRWRDEIIRKRDEIIRFRSLATRRRRLQPEEVE